MGGLAGRIGVLTRMDDDGEIAQVRAIWQALGLPGIVDVHTHFMPDNVMAKVWGYFDRAGPLIGRPWPITYRGTEHERLERLRAFGVRRFSSLVYPHRPGMAQWLNAWARDFARRTPDCVPSATLFPEPAAGDYVASALADGAGVFKVHVQVGDFDPNDALLTPAWGALEDARVPVVVHCGSGPAPGRFTGPGNVRTLLRRHPRLRLVVAHLGMPEYGDFLDLAEAHDGVQLDTTMAFTEFTEGIHPFPADLLPRLRDAGDRIVFGSDFPNIPYTYLHAIQSLQRLDLGDDWMRGVLHDNGALLFGIDGPTPSAD